MSRTLYCVFLCIPIAALFCGCDISDPYGENLTSTNFEDEFDPSWSPDGMQIAFTTQVGWSSWKIEIMDVAGKNRRELIDCSGDRVSSPSWSPDGKWIAFACDDKISVMDVDGKNLFDVRLHGDRSNLHSFPAWSPDGMQIAFTTQVGWGSSWKIEIMDADRKNRRELIHYSGYRVSPPSWSPDGIQIAFGTQVGWGSSWKIEIMDVAGKNRRELIDCSGDRVSSPSWSPDGKLIAFVCDGDISVMDADGENLRILTLGSSPSWSPDGKRIAFACDGKISVVDIDGKNERNLVHADGSVYSPSWSPDGRSIAFVLSHIDDDYLGGGWSINDIWVVDL